MNSEMIPKEEETAKTPSSDPHPLLRTLFEYVELFGWSIFIVMMLFTFVIRLCRVDGASMENTLYNGQVLLVSDLGYTPAQDDIIVFHLTQGEEEKALVKRVIATEGQNVVINFATKEIFVDGILYADSHRILKNLSGQVLDYYYLYAEHSYDGLTQTFSATVPEGHLFVLGDNRNNSKDSRDTEIGFIDSRCVLGKAIVRISPFTLFS
ncbi:MAG: signal peptidase I [Clostridia bacterium]|nr:signal peptidase I [Clostridia bacterium]